MSDAEMILPRRLPPGPAGARLLALALRRQAADPDPGFTWDFGLTYARRACGSIDCAGGLAYVLWPRDVPLKHLGYGVEPQLVDLGVRCGMPRDVARCIFYGNSPYASVSERYGYGRRLAEPEDYAAVAPADVADRIDRWLADGGHPTSLEDAP